MKKRLDILLVEKGHCTGRDRAKALVMAGQVYVDNQKALKPGQDIDETTLIEVRGESLAYVSRGGLKLEKAMQVFPIALNGAVCIDIGASTGGFTDCMLQNGAQKVYAVDVGYGQLAWKLRIDERVIILERTNIRKVTEKEIPELADFISIDVSFISLTLVLPVAKAFLKEEGRIVCLIKPQFEAGRDKVGKKGVVRELSTHIEVAKKVTDFAISIGLSPAGFTYSPVKGPEGNIEYLLYLENMQGKNAVDTEEIESVVHRSHEEMPG